MRAWIAILGVLLGCEGGGTTGATTTGSGGAKPAAGSAKGFGADLLRELEDTGSGSGSAAKPPDTKVAAGSGSGSGTGSGSATPPPDTKVAAGSAAKAPETKAPETKAPETKAPEIKAPETKAPETKAPETKAPETKAPETKAPETKAPDTKVAAGSAAKPTEEGSAKVAIKDPKPPVSADAAELKQIKLALLPNWERDVDQVGTFSLAVKVQGRPQPAVFRFRYGFEDSKAPADRDAYKKWLADNKVLVPRQDRQAGAAWFIEGTDGSGSPAFRIVVNYGGRKLICGGSLYKDSESNKLGDLRDQTIIQAKQICESVAL